MVSILMDAVELPLPAAVTVSKLMGSEGCGGVGVKMGEIEIRESDRVSMLVTPSTEAGSSFRSQRGDFFGFCSPYVSVLHEFMLSCLLFCNILRLMNWLIF